MNSVSGIGKAYREKLRRVLEPNPSVLTASHVSKVLEVNTQEAGRLLSRWYKSGWISRVKRGAYIPLTIVAKSNKVVLDEPGIIADSIYAPGYIGGFSAVKHWDFSEQIIETFTYYTLKKVKDRNPVHGGIKFNLKTIVEYKNFGLKNVWYGSHKVKVSDPSKTIIDILDDPKIVGGIRVISDILVEYLDTEHYDFELLVNYASKMRNKTIFKRLGFLLQTKFDVPKEIIEKLRSLISTSYSDLDNTLECRHLIKEWKLRVSDSWKAEYDRKK